VPRSDNTKPTARFDPRKLAKATAERDPRDDLDDAFREWEAVAHGTPMGRPTPNVSRTATVHDPLTTGLLAEVTRQPEKLVAADETPPFEVLVPERPTRRLPPQTKGPRVTPNVIKRKRR
jgi:hypothetical protein